eukprot:TRINITY_DN4269_c1_g3_i2.p1 TRINITY_DN4269_c1_g3~~TRINITY_DN4269_c1_g3_i2.p1  ORF type:complete len:260 (-),score=-19.05 TRINITY_DN4269_c1_g3_i2:109-888(-)
MSYALAMQHNNKKQNNLVYNLSLHIILSEYKIYIQGQQNVTGLVQQLSYIFIYIFLINKKQQHQKIKLIFPRKYSSNLNILIILNQKYNYHGQFPLYSTSTQCYLLTQTIRQHQNEHVLCDNYYILYYSNSYIKCYYKKQQLHQISIDFLQFIFANTKIYTTINFQFNMILYSLNFIAHIQNKIYLLFYSNQYQRKNLINNQNLNIKKKSLKMCFFFPGVKRGVFDGWNTKCLDYENERNRWDQTIPKQLFELVRTILK